MALTLLAGCAKIQAPPGGPEDKTPPKVAGTIPVSGAVKVDRVAPVRIEFSEPVLEEKIAEAVYISPRPSAAPRFECAKQVLWIRWADSLAADVTCLVTVAARVKDRRGNQLAEPFVLAFSTGAAIDSGTIAGTVFDSEKPAANTQVLLFMLPLDSASAIFSAPDYITECGADGRFSFSFLPHAAYRAIAVEDKNKNRMLNRGERAGVGAFDGELLPGNPRSLPLDLYLRASDTTRFELVRCQVSPDRILLAEFSHAMDSLSFEAAKWSVAPVTPADTPRVECVDSDLKSNKTARLLLEKVNVGVSYRLTVEGLADEFGQMIDPTANTGEFYWPAADTTAPTVARSSPAHHAEGVNIHDAVQIWFSEAVDIGRADTAFFLADSTGLRVGGHMAWPCAWDLMFCPDPPLVSGMVYMMAFDSGSYADRAATANTEHWTASFTTMAPGSQGGIAGSLSVREDAWRDKPVVLEFAPTEKKLSPARRVVRGLMAFEYELPAGMYTIRAFVDVNENGRFDSGTILPFEFAEPRFFFPDTVEVRARFVTESIPLTIP